MTEVKSYKPGTFCWADLATTNPTGAKRFYSELFGWKTQDNPLPGGGAYTLARINGGDIAGLMGMPEKGIPPHWNSYVAVANVDEATNQATSLGGKILAPPMDVMDLGRMAVIQDPSGAELSLWQAKKHIGAGRVGGAWRVGLERAADSQCRRVRSLLHEVVWLEDRNEEGRLRRDVHSIQSGR